MGNRVRFVRGTAQIQPCALGHASVLVTVMPWVYVEMQRTISQRTISQRTISRCRHTCCYFAGSGCAFCFLLLLLLPFLLAKPLLRRVVLYPPSFSDPRAGSPIGCKERGIIHFLSLCRDLTVRGGVPELMGCSRVENSFFRFTRSLVARVHLI